MTNPTTPVLFRYWLARFHDAIRIAWTTGQAEHSAELNADGEVTHSTHEVSEDMAIRARYCLQVGLDRDVEGCEYMGLESRDEMTRQIADRCCECGRVVDGVAEQINCEGLCPRCWVAAAPTWLNTLRAAGAL